MRQNIPNIALALRSFLVAVSESRRLAWIQPLPSSSALLYGAQLGTLPALTIRRSLQEESGVLNSSPTRNLKISHKPTWREPAEMLIRKRPLAASLSSHRGRRKLQQPIHAASTGRGPLHAHKSVEGKAIQLATCGPACWAECVCAFPLLPLRAIERWTRPSDIACTRGQGLHVSCSVTGC
ncbi:hypothetical protein VTK26DRAFT_3474 [Humicola hyalothermophila]